MAYCKGRKIGSGGFKVPRFTKCSPSSGTCTGRTVCCVGVPFRLLRLHSVGDPPEGTYFLAIVQWCCYAVVRWALN